jgi:hypothetical protein
MKKRLWMLIFSLMVAGLAACPGTEDPPPPCGGTDETCCEINPPCHSPLVCTDGNTCKPAPACGGNGQACCADRICNTPLVCGGENTCGPG